MPPPDNWWAGFRAAGCTELKLDDYAAMLRHRQLLTEKFPNLQDTDYLKQMQQDCGS